MFGNEWRLWEIKRDGAMDGFRGLKEVKWGDLGCIRNKFGMNGW